MKLGYVSRVAVNNPYEHTILATQFFKPKDFALQINLSLNNIWGIVKMICELLLSKEDGKYVLMKDPNKAIVRLYAIPLDAFDREDTTTTGGAGGENSSTAGGAEGDVAQDGDSSDSDEDVSGLRQKIKSMSTAESTK